MSYKIMGTYKGKTEEIDSAKTLSEAVYLKGEYQLAFGRDWVVSIKRGKQKCKTIHQEN